MTTAKKDLREYPLEPQIINIQELYYRIIKNHIFELLKIINFKYQDKFLKNNLKLELDHIITNINLSMILLQPNAIKISAARSKKNKIQPVIDYDSRCRARIWDNIFDRATNKIITEIENEFQVSDYNDINIKKFNKKYILGKQCARKKISNSNYCYQHNRHHPHGDYIEPPSKELCLHFMIDGEYLEKKSNDE
jgi:hypothetical protein